VHGSVSILSVARSGLLMPGGPGMLTSTVRQPGATGSLRPGRPIRVRVGDPLDVVARGVSVDDHDAVRALTDELMAALTAEVEALRAAYPPEWASR